MISTFIASKDRPSQLLLLLESLDKNAHGIFDPHILYLASNDCFSEGYNIVTNTLLGKNCHWHQQRETGEIQFYKFLEYNADNDNLICLYSDDCIFYKKMNVTKNELNRLFMDTHTFSFTFRLGKNITVKDYVINEPAIIPKEYYIFGPILSWDYTKVPFWHPHGFTVGFDGYVYKAKDILELSEHRSFPRICEWEHMICDRFLEKGHPKKYMASPYTSCLFTSQVNTVHGLAHRSSHEFNISPEELNNKLLDGYKIDLSGFNWENINCTHGERKFEFINYE